MIAAIYARKSTDQNGVADEQKSVTRQVEHARDYADSNGWTVAEDHIYVDDGISGAEFTNRPGFIRMMNTLNGQPPFQALVMSEESRLGREQIEVSYALKQLITSGVRVFCYQTDSERTLDSPIEKAMLALQAMADEMEREKAAQRVTDAMRRKAKAKHVCGGRTFGYDNVEITGPDGKRSHVERRINEEEAEVVKEIFELCAEGFGKTRIAKLLNERGRTTPRAQQGRPRAWAGSSIGELLYRDLYRGLIVWNKSKKRDSWGKQSQKARPKSEWIEVEAPELRIVPEKLWDAVHARLAATRKNYLRQQNGQLWGRPPSGEASKYLLVGLARCGHCGAGLEMRSRASGKRGRRLYYYSCSSFYRRGPAICPNRFEIPMPVADSIVIDTMLSELLTPKRLTKVVERAAEIARAEAAEAPDLKAGLERELAECQSAQERLTTAVAAGGELPALVDALKAQENLRQGLEARLAALEAPPVVVDGELEGKIAAAVAEWRELLGRRVPQARQILNKLLAEKLVFTPEDRDGQRGFLFSATGTVEKLIEGTVPGRFLAVASPTGFEPVLPA